MSVEMLTEAVRMDKQESHHGSIRRDHAQTAEAIAATGVDLISIGWITHSAPALDLVAGFQPWVVDISPELTQISQISQRTVFIPFV